ncbi:glutamate--tRNA ligase [Aureimonas phyllosphaerae]|uniref:Glutamate--tRNA ligase n=1 Tax=Aureimonas phyllosphaerae TaxID=1166078 RepID=A0A7W6BWU0_9HYPH|nr:glutamate--tRNA ligase [Aureimonas phyllosphaerae]MBB3935201.1 glutamyl-tRNA synthetase [Aureimonas phyllosphaerae]MBB3959209.1 glutamyl-tRNA synthetase [Aureimonas phyllosphaerae]SFF06471.1 glutamyl-tRNA synthetase [Aureimonas phyllosphaerae]
MTVFVRFAPSPTGYLHIGNLRPALFNWLFAQRRGGRFLLRYDDTDRERSKTEYAEAIAEDLAWIGIRPDAVARQSDRLSHYDAAADLLRDSGALYPCYETAEELERMRKRRMGRGLPPVYGREALRLTAEDRLRLEAEGLRPHWRFRLPNFASDPLKPERTDVHWDDVVRGRQTVDLASLSDPVLIREDGTYLYTFCSVVDDGEMGITHVLRGDDHVTNTGVQIAIFEALGHAVPAFGHFNLLTTIDGEGLSKRTGALSLRSLRDDGLEPMAVASLAVLTGLSGSIEAMSDLTALEARLDFNHVSASSSKFDPAELHRLNAELVHAMPYAAVSDRLRDLGVPDDRAEEFWMAVRRNCERVRDAEAWRDIVFGAAIEKPPLKEDDLAFAREAFDLLPECPWDAGTWKLWTERLKAATGRKGRALFMPLRLALTGLEHGPELADLLPLIGPERAAGRRP